MFIERLWRRFHREPERSTIPYEIVPGVPFKPFENATHFCRPGEGAKPFLVPEAYPHTLALRTEVILYQINGVIDVITDDPNDRKANIAALLSRLKKPLGETHFESIYSC